MAKYRKRPVVIEALELRWDNWSEMCEFADVGRLEDGQPQGCYIQSDGSASSSPTDEIGMWIPTLEGVMIARQHDMIIKGVEGELYPCKPQIFIQTYEIVSKSVLRREAVLSED